MNLSRQELERYSRQTLLPNLGVDGQTKLKKAKVLLVGVGGLGSPCALYLAAAGVGTLGIIDDDQIDVSNLQRQVLYKTSEVGKSKAQTAKKQLNELNPHIDIHVHETRLTENNCEELVNSYDLVVDGTDNFQTRYLVNDTCVLSKTPHVYASIYQYEGHATLFSPNGPCYRCLHPTPPPAELVPSCAEGGVLGILPGVMGSIQATETIKYLTGIGESLSNRLLLYSALEMRFNELPIAKDENCPVCSENATIKSVKTIEQTCSLKGPDMIDQINVFDLNTVMKNDEIYLLDVREDYEREACLIEPSLHIPLGSVEKLAHTLPKDKPMVVYCKAGVRSQAAIMALQEQGFSELKNLEGGIISWIQHIDPSQQLF